MTCVCLYVCLSGGVVLCFVVLCCGCQRKKVMSAQAQRDDKMARQAYQVPPLSPYLGPYLGPYLAFPTWLSLPGASPLPSPFSIFYFRLTSTV